MPLEFHLTPSYAYPQSNKCESCKQLLRPENPNKYNWIVAKTTHFFSPANTYHVKCLQKVLPPLEEFKTAHQQSNMERITDRMAMLVCGFFLGCIPAGLAVSACALTPVLGGCAVSMISGMINQIAGTQIPFANFDSTIAAATTFGITFFGGITFANAVTYLGKKIFQQKQACEDESIKVMRIYRKMIDDKFVSLGIQLSLFAWSYFMLSLPPSKSERMLPLELISSIQKVAGALGLAEGFLFGQKNIFFSTLFFSHEVFFKN